LRGLILLSVPEPEKIVAELISDGRVEPASIAAARQPHAHHHQAEIQVLTGQGPAAPRPLLRGSRVEINAPKSSQVVRSQSYLDFVPKLSAIAARSQSGELKANSAPRNDDFVRSTVTINGGVLRVKNVTTWDASGFPLDGGEKGVTPARPALLKFLGCDVQGHMANEVIVEIESDTVTISGAPEVKGRRTLNAKHTAVQTPNPHTSHGNIEILINNFEFQRAKPAPWGLDFQWMFMRAGYAPIDLSRGDFIQLNADATKYDKDLWNKDLEMLMRDPTKALPFPYIVNHNRLTPLNPLPARPAAEIDSRPVCVPGEE
jgi:hypothetical protein